jgi:hypothetical protein
MARKLILSTVASAMICLGIAPVASAGTPIRLVLSQGAAFSVLGASCGGIQEEVFATGFAPDGYPTGVANLKTRCGGSGRGGGYKTTTYTGTASVVWDWLGETRSFAAGPTEYSAAFEATDSQGDRIYNSGGSAFLETGEPPLAPPAAPTSVTATPGWVELGETEYQQFTVTWTADPAVAGLISSSTVTATPIHGGPVLTAQTSGSWNQAALGPVTGNTVYRITVTSTDAEGTSVPSTVEVNSGGEAGEGGGEEEPGEAELCEQNQGTIKLSPGLSETPHVQNITVKGTLGGCAGPLSVTGAKYTAHLRTTEEVTCATLASVFAEPKTTALSVVVKFSPGASGSSTGSLLMPLSEAALEGFGGTLEGGPFKAPAAFSAAVLGESFTGGPSCGLPSPNGKVKAVKSGTFTTSAVEIG